MSDGYRDHMRTKENARPRETIATLRARVKELEAKVGLLHERSQNLHAAKELLIEEVARLRGLVRELWSRIDTIDEDLAHRVCEAIETKGGE